VRHSSDEVPPTLFHRQQGGHVMVVSEPLDEDDDCQAWREVPAGHLLVIEKHGRLDIAPFIPKV